MLRTSFIKTREIDPVERSLSIPITDIIFAIMSGRSSKFVITALKELMDFFSAAERSLSEIILIISKSVTARLKIIFVAYLVQRLSLLKNEISVSVSSTELFSAD
jgi:hypothetical protein